MTDMWKPVAGYESIYAVSRDGLVRSVRNGRIMAPVMNSDGYPTVKLHRAGVGQRFRIHRLVCEAFHGPAPSSAPFAAHLDGDKLNSRSDNLAWVSRSENEGHKAGHGTVASGSRNGRAKLSEEDARAIRALWDAGQSASAIGLSYGIHPSTAHRVGTGQRYRSDDSAGPQGIAHTQSGDPA